MRSALYRDADFQALAIFLVGLLRFVDNQVRRCLHRSLGSFEFPCGILDARFTAISMGDKLLLRAVAELGGGPNGAAIGLDGK